MIILASASPRRQDLLSLICEDFSVEPADIDETIEEEIELEKKPEYLAVKKAKHIQGNNHYDDIVIGCDTGVFLDGIMLGKPSSESNAVAIQMMDDVRRADIHIVPIEDDVFILPLDVIKQHSACWGVFREQGEQGFKGCVEFHLKDFLSCV